MNNFIEKKWANIVGDAGEELALGIIIGRAKRSKYHITTGRKAPFDKNDTSRYLTYDYYIKIENGTNGFFDTREFLIEIKSSYNGKPSDSFKIKTSQVHHYREIEKQQNIEYVFYFVDFDSEVIYKIPSKEFFKYALKSEKYYTFYLDGAYFYEGINDYEIEKLEISRQKMMENDKNSLFSI